MPRRLHARLVLLLVAVVIAALAAATVAFGLSTRESSAERVARALHAQVIAADALLARQDRDAATAGLAALGIVRRADPPPGERSSLRFLIRTEARVGARLPGRTLRLSGTPARLWVRAAPPGEGWVGIPVMREGQPLRRGLLLSLIAIGALVLAAAALFARSLTRPLRMLADAAPGIVAGEPPPAPPPFASDEILELQRALADAAERTRAAARDRELMLAGISHDMRTPLARLRYALALEDRGADAAAREGMERDIDELDGIVGQFIDYVRDGRDEPLEQIDLGELIREVVSPYNQHEEKVRLCLEPLRLSSLRRVSFKRLLVNLIDNALRYGGEGVEVAASVAGGCSAPYLSISVLDRGPGLEPGELDNLFNPFIRGDSARGGVGSGLGLAIVRRIAALHGASVELRNRAGGGLEARVCLPLGLLLPREAGQG